jgi:sigma-B regulation protein RsbU (phosphoserine phosphatase)
MRPFSSATDTDRISRVVFDYAAKIGSAPNTQALLLLNADLARDLIGADRCSVWLVDTVANELWTKVAHGVDEIRIPRGQGLVSASIESNEAIVVNDTASDSRFLGVIDQSSGYVTQSVAVLPLHGENASVIGALQALNKPGGFSMSDVELLGLAAVYCASAIETQRLRQEAEAAQRLYQELEIARGVQKQLLPQHPPRIPGLAFAAFCRPAQFVGGDYYDFVTLPGDKIALTQGDVSGKGVAAAVLMASIQTSLRSQLMLDPDSLARLMTDFNTAVCSFSAADRYSTLFCSILDMSTRKITYVNAGHVRPLVLRGGELIQLSTGGMPVGLLEYAGYEQATVQLEPDDTVLCYSDGFSDAANWDRKPWGDARVEELLVRTRGASVQEIVNRLVKEADAFTGTAPQSDDMTAIVFRV